MPVGQLPAPLVSSVSSKTGVVVLDKADVGLGNVDNTSDANKPVSTLQAAALAAKQSLAQKSQAEWLCVPGRYGESSACRATAHLWEWQSVSGDVEREHKCSGNPGRFDREFGLVLYCVGRRDDDHRWDFGLGGWGPDHIERKCLAKGSQLRVGDEC